MRSYYKCVQLLRNLLESNEDVNTIMHSARSMADLQKKNIYPLAVINPVAAGFDVTSVNTFDFEIAVLDQRDLSNDDIIDKFKSNDNEIDNLNTCHAVLNRLVMELRNKLHDDNIRLTAITNLTPLLESNLNLLDGWFVTVTLSIPNTISIC